MSRELHEFGGGLKRVGSDFSQRGMGAWDDFKKFLMRGNVIDLAVAIIIGNAFNAIVNSLVNDIILPPIGLIVERNLGGIL